MASFEQLREKVQRLKARYQELEGRRKAHDEEMKKVQKEIRGAGYKSFRSLKEANDEAKEREEKYKGRLEELLDTWEED